MKINKHSLLLLIFALTFTYCQDNSCLVVTNDYENKTFKIVEEKNESQWWFKSYIEFKLKNNCPKAAYINNLAVTIEKLLVNNKSNYQFSHISVTPWLINDFKQIGDNYIINLSCQSSENWGKIQPNGTITIKAHLGFGEKIQEVTTRLIYTNAAPKQQVADVKFSVNNIPNGQNLIIKISELGTSRYVEKVLTTDNNVYTYQGVPLNTAVDFIITGYWGQTLKINSVHDYIVTSEAKLYEKVINLGQSNFPGRQVAVTANGFNFNQVNFRPITFILTSKNYVYEPVYITKNFFMFFVPVGENMDLEVVSPIGWDLQVINENGGSQKLLENSTYYIINCTRSNKKRIGAYYETWSSKFKTNLTDNSLANLPSYIDTLLIAFGDPHMTYKKGSFASSRDTTGLDFLAPMQTVKELIKLAKKNNPRLKVLLSVGGWSFNDRWVLGVNFQNIVDIVEDFGFDGVDIDHETSGECYGWVANRGDNENIKCQSDAELINIFTTFRKLLPKHQLLTAATWSIGCYGIREYPANENKPEPSASSTAKFVNPLRTAGLLLDEIFIMSYDATKEFNYQNSANCYKQIYNGPISIGLEVPPEAWPKDETAHVLTPQEAQEIARYTLRDDKLNIFIWSLHKHDGLARAKDFLVPVCNIYQKDQCSKFLPED